MELETILRKCATTNKSEVKSEDNEKREDEYFQKIYEQWKGAKAKDKDLTYKVIPKFYFKLPKEDEILPQKLREETRALFLQRRSRQLLDNNELKALWVLLDKHHSPPLSGEEQLINYEDFKKVGKLAGAKCSPYFTAVVFAKLQQGDPHGRISIMALFNYVMRKVWLHQTRIGLSLYDVTGQGYLRESDLENYILELIPTLPQLEGLEKSFHSFYVCTAVRKFLFFLDPLRTGRVRIQDILACSFLDDLLELRDEDLPKDLQEANWFSAPSALKVYGQYLNLDRDHNGMLNKEELAGYGTGTLTGVFLERVFQECLTYEGEMDYKTYLDFVLALENRHEPQSLHYLFRILDINNRGYLDTFCLNYFFRAIQEQMTMHGQEPVSFEDVKDEIFDMVKPADPCKITLQDLLSCGQGDTMVSILIEFHGFWAYENREAMAADTGDESSHSPRKSVSKSIINENNEHINKENGKIGLCNVKTKLQRLGRLYSDDSSRELSSPIHRTEEKFHAEEEEEVIVQKTPKRGARLDRLAALASTINNWEDDLSHPTLVKPVSNKADKIQAKLNQQVKCASEPQPSTSGYNKGSRNSKGTYSKKEESCSTKQLKWDKTILETLEAQGFSRTESDSRLVYDYKACSQEKDAESSSSSPKHLRQNQETIMTLYGQKNYKKGEDSTKHKYTKNSNTPEKTSRNATSSTNSTRLTPRYGLNGSPKSPAQSSPGSVLSKASLFESKNTEAKVKDPTQMTLSERMALFEKNKGEAPLLPKAPLTMSIPPKKLQEKDKTSSPTTHSNSGAKERPKADIPNNAVNVQREKFEQGLNMQELENNILRNTYLERQRELDMLRSRFNRNKEMAQAAAGSYIRTSESSEGKPNSPKNSPICPVKPTPAPDQGVPPPPPLPPQSHISNEKLIPNENKNSPNKRQVVGSPMKTTQQVKIASDIKRIRVAPPKPGHLYPNLSKIENTTETETDTEYTVNSTEAETATLDEKTDTETGTEAEYYVQDNETETESEEEKEDMNSSLGRSILRVVNEQSFLNKKRSIDPDPDSTTSDISVLDEMDEYLDECLALQETHTGNAYVEEGPTPPKLNKGGKSPSTASTSFKYSDVSSYRSPIKKVTSASPKKGEPYIVDGENCVPLMHSISFYRRQQSQTPKTPVRIISRAQESTDIIPDTTQIDVKEEAILVQEKVKRLLDEVCKQQTIIGQASQALNLCTSTVEFNGSREQVEGERLLLVATHRRQAALNEVQRLKVEGTLKPVSPGSPEVQESGSLTVSAITLPLKRDYFRNMGTSTCLHFVCLMRHLEEIVVTPIVVAEPGDSCLRFPSTLKLNDLYNDFKITIEIYSLQTQPEILPHEIKYHINNGNGCSNSSNNCNKKLVNKTPKKFLKQESRLVMPNVQSPAGPSAVRSPSFQLSGYVIFSLKEIHRQQFTLNKVPPQSPLEGRLQMHVSCELSVAVEHRGFLTMFEDVSGFGAWHRRWCLLKGSTLSYWKYPDDERKKAPIGSLDLQNVSTTNVGLVSRDICARPNTFLLETTRAAEPEDTESLIMVRNGNTTIIRHLLSADTKEDRLEWCSKINKTLNLIHAWGGPLAFS
ncbi:PREDICTED: actin-binding protein anillin-like [Eufriesea mexicana]|uniref:actin-binding protein anillin-like n=1 Tax=Eufriesea mexicana TaxID=516756 RepID=UPI00083BBDF1|nr:PREDICTED: actin-binding protein anillin-like [Eufriesea mexicana]